MPPTPEPRPVRYDPQSADAMFARILTEIEADRRDRTAFRAEVRERFDKGAERMDGIDSKVDEVRAETRKTNGRVTKLEGEWKRVAAKIAAGATVLYAVGQTFLWLLEKGYISFGA